MPEPISNEALMFEVRLLTQSLGAVKADVEHHEQDLYRGDRDMPALMTRVYNLERVSKALEWIAAASVMTFLSVMGWIVGQLLKAWGH